MRYLILTLILSGCSTFGPSSTEADREWRILSEVAADQHGKFTYISDMDKHGVPHLVEQVTGDAPYTGDCEEFALASWNQAYKRGLLLAPRMLPNHVIMCGRFWCVDNLHVRPFLPAAYFPSR